MITFGILKLHILMVDKEYSAPIYLKLKVGWFVQKISISGSKVVELLDLT